MIEMASRRAQQSNNFEYHKMVRQIAPMYSGWTTNEEFNKQYNFRDTPELTLSRAVVQNTLNNWGFLFREGVIGEDFIERLYNPWLIIRYWETFKPLILENRENMGNQKKWSDLEYLYNVMKKKFPNLSKDTTFAFQWYYKE